MSVDVRASIEAVDADLTAKLRSVQARIVFFEEQLAAAKAERVDIIDEAVACRWSLARIGAALGVTKQRVQQLRR